MLTAQEEARILAKIRKDSYGITLEQMKQFFIEHQHAREIGDKKMMEKIEYHLTYINFHYECGLLATGQYDKLPEVIKKVTWITADRGFCKDVFATVEKPTRYYNRIFENYTGEVATWYSASPSIFESDCPIHSLVSMTCTVSLPKLRA